MARYAALALVLCAALVALACGGTSGPTAGATTPTTRTPAPGATATTVAESGEEPIFWRTADNFASLQAGQPYKVLLRITGGYAEPTLNVTATCQSCPQPSEREPITLEAERTEPVGGDAPGSYYPLNVTLPAAGRWEINVVAGSDTAKILVDAQPSESSG